MNLISVMPDRLKAELQPEIPPSSQEFRLPAVGAHTRRSIHYNGRKVGAFCHTRILPMVEDLMVLS